MNFEKSRCFKYNLENGLPQIFHAGTLSVFKEGNTNYLLIFCQCPQGLESENNAFNNELICTLWVRSMNYLMAFQKQVW